MDLQGWNFSSKNHCAGDLPNLQKLGNSPCPVVLLNIKKIVELSFPEWKCEKNCIKVKNNWFVQLQHLFYIQDVGQKNKKKSE